MEGEEKNKGVDIQSNQLQALLDELDEYNKNEPPKDVHEHIRSLNYLQKEADKQLSRIEKRTDRNETLVYVGFLIILAMFSGIVIAMVFPIYQAYLNIDVQTQEDNMQQDIISQ